MMIADYRTRLQRPVRRPRSVPQESTAAVAAIARDPIGTYRAKFRGARFGLGLYNGYFAQKNGVDPRGNAEIEVIYRGTLDSSQNAVSGIGYYFANNSMRKDLGVQSEASAMVLFKLFGKCEACPPNDQQSKYMASLAEGSCGTYKVEYTLKIAVIIISSKRKVTPGVYGHEQIHAYHIIKKLEDNGSIAQYKNSITNNSKLPSEECRVYFQSGKDSPKDECEKKLKDINEILFGNKTTKDGFSTNIFEHMQTSVHHNKPGHPGSGENATPVGTVKFNGVFPTDGDNGFNGWYWYYTHTKGKAFRGPIKGSGKGNGPVGTSKKKYPTSESDNE